MCAMSSSDHQSAALRRFTASVLAKAQECVDEIKPSDDMSSLKDLCDAANKLVQTLNKLPAFGRGGVSGEDGEGGGSEDKSVEDLQKEMGGGDVGGGVGGK